MNNPNNLFNMMQTGGLTSTAGGTALARALQMQSDREKLEKQQRAEAKRQKRGGLFGSIGSLAGGLLGAALTPFTGGASLALASGLGAGLGRRVGEGLGAGKSRKYDREGTVFGQQAFRDVEQASRDYTRGMGERALVSGLQAATSAYFNPTGMYGKVQGKLRKPTGFDVNPAFSMPSSYGSELAGDIDMTASNAEMASLLEEQVRDTPEELMGIVNRSNQLPFRQSSNKINPEEFFNPDTIKNYFESKPLISYMDTEKFAQPSLPKGSLLRRTRNTLSDIKNLGLARTLGIGGKSFAEDVTRQGILDNAGLLMGQDIDEFAFLDDVQEQPNMQASLLGLRDKVNQYNSPLGFQDGGYTAKAILQEAGFAPSEEQLGLFQQFDPGEIERAKERTEQSLLSMTGGMGLSSMGGGFGARQRAATSAIGRGEDLIGDTIEQSQRDFESQTLGTMADLIASGAEFDKDYSYRTNVPTDNPSWSPPPMPSEGATYNFGGQNYIYNGSEWLTEYEFYADEQAGQD